MEQFEEVLKNVYDMSITSVDETHLYARNDKIFALIMAPFDDNESWQVRFSTVAAFDRWCNSSGFWEYFRTSYDAINYLKNHKLDVYEELLDYLSSEYEDLKDAYRNS